MALSGLEHKLKKLINKRHSKVNVISYADDFIITGASPELLKEAIVLIEEFLKERGLELSQEKSKITNIEDGFNFLGLNVRKYNGKLLIKPAKDNIKSFLKSIREVIKANRNMSTENLINLLNPKIIGWTNYFRTCVASKTFSYVDNQIYKALYNWMRRRHNNKSNSWIKRKYFRKLRLSNLRFCAMVKDNEGNNKPLYLHMARSTTIRRHIKIRNITNPYNPEFREYFKKRESMTNTYTPKGMSGISIGSELPGWH